MKKIFIALIVVVLAIAAGCYYFFFVYSQKAKPAPSSATELTTTPGVTDTEILIGSSAALSGTASRLGINLLSGANIAVKEINDAGGINGRKFKLISYDDKYDPPAAVENTQKLINEDKVFALSNYVGTPTGIKVVPIVEEAKIPLVGMFTGAHAFREPLQKYIFNIRGSYYQETELAVKYFVDDLGYKKIGVLYQADAFGLDGFEGVKIALDKRGLKPTATGSYERATTNVEEAVSILSVSDAEVIIMIGTYTPLAKFVKLVKAKKPEMFFDTVSFVGSEAFAKELDTDTSNIFVTQVVPPPYYGELFDGVKNYSDSLAKYDPTSQPTFGGLEGYVNVKILAHGILLAGKNLTREKLVTALESMDNYDIGIGADVTINSTDHQGLDKVYLTNINNNKFVLIPVK